MSSKSVIATSLICVLTTCGCATQAAKTPLSVQQMALPPAPASVMVKREANFQSRLLNFFSASPEKLTK